MYHMKVLLNTISRTSTTHPKKHISPAYIKSALTLILLCSAVCLQAQWQDTDPGAACYVPSLTPDKDNDGVPDMVDLDNDNDGILDVGEETCIDCDPSIPVTNGSFEQNLGNCELGGSSTTFCLTDESNLPGWNTTASDNAVEIWASGFQGTPAQDGDFYMELNASEESALFQSLCLLPGTIIEWSIWHRGRSGVESAEIYIGNAIPAVGQYPPPGNLETTMTTGTAAWVQYSGNYTVPAGQNITTFTIASIPGGGSSGNFIDNFQVTILEEGCCDTDDDGICNRVDLDSDNDGIPDAIEACGNIGLTLDQCSLDFDGDGGYTAVDTNGCITGEVDLGECYGAPNDTDGDGIPDFVDLDSDGDGCYDNQEALTDNFETSTDTYLPGDGTTTTTDDCGLLLNTISTNCPIPIDNGWVEEATEAISCPAAITLTGEDESVITAAASGYDFSTTPVYITDFPVANLTTEFDVVCVSSDPEFGVCSYSVTYQDAVTAMTGCNLTVERIFSLTTNCNVNTCTQIISVSNDCATGETTTQTCDDGDPCTINDVETILNCDDSVCVPCMGEPTTPPEPTLVCPTELNACATDGSNIFDCMFSDANPVTQAAGSEANPIIGGANASVVSTMGIIDASTLSVGTYTFTLNYESPAGCFGTPVTCTFTVISSKSADAGLLNGGN